MKTLIIAILLIPFILISCNKDSDDISSFPAKNTTIKLDTSPFRPVSFHIQYHGELDCQGRTVAYLDLYNYNSDDIKKCRESGTRIVIAYFSSQWSSWYPDSGGDCLGHDSDTCTNKFTEAMLGKDLPDWKGERFVNPNDPDVRQIMLERMTLARDKGYDGIDVDNTDFYHFNTGFDLDKTDAINYLNFFIKSAHSSGLLFSLKNSMDLINNLSYSPDFFQNESCYRYSECDIYRSVDAPVFIIRYKRRCPKELYHRGFTILKKKMNQKDKVCN